MDRINMRQFDLPSVEHLSQPPDYGTMQAVYYAAVMKATGLIHAGDKKKMDNLAVPIATYVSKQANVEGRAFSQEAARDGADETEKAVNKWPTVAWRIMWRIFSKEQIGAREKKFR